MTGWNARQKDAKRGGALRPAFFLFGPALLAACLGAAPGCKDGASAADTGSASSAAASAEPRDVSLPGVDTSAMTPRERHEFTSLVTSLFAPCPSVPVSVATCVLEKRACGTCSQAAKYIAHAVRAGAAESDITRAYKDRYDPSGVKALPLSGSPSRGPDDAPVTIVEFADFECPFCQRMAPELDRIWEAHKEKVRFVYKFMPLSMHPHGESSARAAAAAQLQGKFWDLHHQLFANGEHLDPGEVDGYAHAVGLDVARLHTDMQSPAVDERLAADRKLADELGVKGTPTIYIDGREYDVKLDLGEWIAQEIAARSK